MLGMFWEHPPALDPKAVGRAIQWIRDRIHDLEDTKRALLQEKEALHVDLAFSLESNRGGNKDSGGTNKSPSTLSIGFP
ncbi:hypothetical protein MKX01_021692 [Papaver californicum]|nr:hypothetical protein MKX01_021692 [Papaver californicum]